MSRRIFFFIVLALLIALSSCSATNQKADYYVSFTLSWYNDESITGITNSVFDYDLSTKKSTRILDLDYTSQYPLSLYSKKHNKVFFTADDGKGSDQIFAKDLDTDEIRQISFDFFAINYIYELGDDLVTIAVKNGERVLRPYVIKLSEDNLLLDTREHIDFEFMPDINTISPNADYLIMAGYDSIIWETEDRTRPRGQFPYSDYLYYFDGEIIKQLAELEHQKIYHLSVDFNDVIHFSTAPDDFYPIDRYYELDLKKCDSACQPVEVECPFKDDFKVFSNYYYLNDDEVIVQGNSIPDDKYPYGIYRYNLKTHQVTKFVDSDLIEGGYINNFVLMPNPKE